MFTGIVQSVLPLAVLEREPGLARLAFRFPEALCEGLAPGASVAVNGTCLTVTRIAENLVWFDVIRETLNLTNLGELTAGVPANIERSLRFGDELGGHLLSGHVDGTARILQVEADENNRVLTLSVEPSCLACIFHKGFLALNGASLTVAALDREEGTVTVHLIPETLARTSFGALGPGDRVNLEVDAQTRVLVETTETLLRERGLIS